MKVAEVSAIALTAPWETIFGGAESVPSYLWRPAAHFTDFARRGQYCALVTVRTEDGVEGWGEAWGLPLPTPVALLINDYLGPALRGQEMESPADIAAWLDKAQTMAESLGYGRGLWREALSGIDLALWDALAREAGVSVGRLRGEEKAAPVPCYASPVPFLQTPEDSATHAGALVQRGFRGLKLKMGRVSVTDDICHYRAVREAVGPETALMADFNCRGTAESVRALARAAGNGLCWIEEPLQPEDIAGMAALRRTLEIPLATGENEFTPDEFKALLRAGAVDIVTPNITRCGGLTGLLRIAETAAAHDARVSLHGVGGAGMLAASVQALADLPNASWMERNVLPNPLRDELTPTPPQEINGSLLPSDGLGWGFVPDRAVIQRYAV